MNVDRHTKNTITSDIKKLKKIVESNFYNSMETYYDHEGNPMYLTNSRRDVIKQNVPIHVGLAILDYSKLRMLQFVYDFLYVYFDRNRIQGCMMDTDSYGFSLAIPTIRKSAL